MAATWRDQRISQIDGHDPKDAGLRKSPDHSKSILLDGSAETGLHDWEVYHLHTQKPNPV
jgi:hypothetical protein